MNIIKIEEIIHGKIINKIECEDGIDLVIQTKGLDSKVIHCSCSEGKEVYNQLKKDQYITYINKKELYINDNKFQVEIKK